MLLNLLVNFKKNKIRNTPYQIYPVNLLYPGNLVSGIKSPFS